MDFNKLNLYFDQNSLSCEFNKNLEFLEYTGNFFKIKLNSVYQPIIDLKESSIIGYEALLRAYYNIDDKTYLYPPQTLFNTVESSEQIIYLDRLCRTIHAFNFVEQSQDITSLLFLNISPKHLHNIKKNHGTFFEQLLNLCDLSPTRVVLEILESAFEDKQELIDIIANYKQVGYQIAIDDFGVNHSNFDRLWLLQPQIVKIDRSILAQAETNLKIRKVLNKLVEIIHELDAEVVIEGIETQDQFLIAKDSGAEFAQGYFIARPTNLIYKKIHALSF